MNSNRDNFKAKSNSTSRRKFLSTCAACGACIAISPFASIAKEPNRADNSLIIPTAKSKFRIRVIYSLHDVVQPTADWPNIAYNFGPVMENYNSILTKNFPRFDFLPTLAAGQPDAEKILLQDKEENISGYIVFQLNCWNRVVQTIAKSGKPVIYVDFKYGGSGGFLSYTANFLKEQSKNVGFVSSSRVEDLISAVKCFEVIERGGSVNDFVTATALARIKSTPAPGNLSCREDRFKTLSPDETIRRMRESKILALRDQVSMCADPIMEIPLDYISFAELNYAWETADKHEATVIAERWQKSANRVIGVQFNILQDSAAMYLAMKSVLKNHKANAITINCLGGFYSNQIQAYPCLGFHELNNEGLVGACECDIPSTATMVAFTTMTQGRPGYISDPVIDTSKRQIIYAHCVASNKVFGPDGPENPFEIMTHSEDRQGASVRSILPVDYMTTTLQINQNRKEILFHQAKAVGNDPDDRACRTKLCGEPKGDIEKLFRYWGDWGWHRVTFYGDLKEQVYAFADAMNWKVVEEA